MTQAIYITTNLTCNLDCVYCYEKDKSCHNTFNIDLAKNTLQKCLQNTTHKGTLISLHGGEPFLSFNKIKELSEWAWSQNFPEKFIIFATSNGTLIHGEIKEWLYKNKHRFIVGLSLDGTREMHNANRSNSFDLIDLDFFAKTYPNQGIKMTISPQTINTLADGIIFMHESGFKDIRANLAEMVDWSDSKYIGIYQRELQKLALYYKQNPNTKECSLFNILFSSVLNEDKRKWCGAGTEMEAIDIDGRKYPCHLFFESVCGKEKSSKAHLIDFSNPCEYISDYCKPCAFLCICPTCYGSNYIARGHIKNRDLSICKLNQIRFYEVAKYEYDRIVNDDTDVSNLCDNEKYKRLRTLESIKKLIPYFGNLR